MRLPTIYPGEAERCRLTQFVDRKDRPGVPFCRIRRKNILCERLCRVTECTLFLVKLEIHVRPPFRRRMIGGAEGVSMSPDADTPV